LELFIETFHINDNVLKKNLQGEFKGLKVLLLAKCVAQSLVRVNEIIISQLRTREGLDEVKTKFQQLVAPAVAIHQHCEISQKDKLTSKIFESVLEVWCMVPGYNEFPKEFQEFMSDAFSSLFEVQPIQKENSFKNRDHIDQSVDHQLSRLYRQAMKAVHTVVLGELGGGN